MLLSYLFKEDTPDEEERVDAPPQDFRTIQDSEKAGSDAAQRGQAIRGPEDDSDSEHDDDQEYDEPLSDVALDQPDTKPRGPRRILSTILSSIFPCPNDEEEIQAYIPHYRILPILSGIAIPFSILLDIPGLTADWYTRFQGSTVVASKPNPPLLEVGIALGLFCAVLANVCLVIRFLERRIKLMTILCIVFLSMHDMINLAALVTFGVTKGDYMLSQAFWMTLCSTIVSMFTNVTLIIDFIRTSHFKQSGSGLTRRQRSLVIIIIGLFFYLALGALVNSFLLDLTFINGLYFTVVTIETIGFGDIVPTSRGSRVFICFYATLGIINLAFVVGYVRETVLEGLDFGYRKRLLAIQERRRAAHRRRRVEKRWRHAVIWRLRERHAPIWIPKNTNNHRFLLSILSSSLWRAGSGILSVVRKRTHQSRGQHGTQLNLWALPPCQLESAALEAGCTLDNLLPPGFYDTYDPEPCHHTADVKHHGVPPWFVVHPIYHRDEHSAEPLTHRRLGAMAAILTKLGFVVYESGGDPLPNGHHFQDASATGPQAAFDSSRSLQTNSEDGGDYREDVEDTEKKAYYTRFSLSWGWFLVFWMGGAAIFQATEGWTYGSSVYFCFISFSTIGYGDLTPTTPASRSIFVVWALIGVATMTTFISVISEAYSTRYKGILGRNSFKQAVRQYRKRNSGQKVQRIESSAEVDLVVQDTLEREETDTQQELSSASATAGDGDGAIASTSKSDPRAQHAQRSLEKLPKQILTETRSIQQYMQLINNLDGRSAQAGGFESVWSLIDDVMGGRKLAELTKQDILKDSESRQTLMMLGIERSVKELVSISEQAMAAAQERDRIIAALEREKEQYEAGNGT